MSFMEVKMFVSVFSQHQHSISPFSHIILRIIQFGRTFMFTGAVWSLDNAHVNLPDTKFFTLPDAKFFAMTNTIFLAQPACFAIVKWLLRGRVNIMLCKCH